jgi:hypothetical protein
MIVCIVDTSVVCELLAIPGKTSRHDQAVEEFEARRRAGHHFILPLASIIETGNHVAQVSDGTARRSAAERFVELVTGALDGASPFVPSHPPKTQDVRRWIGSFVDDATHGIGLADRSILEVFHEQCAFHPHGRVYVWSFDDHLHGYDSAK